MLSLLVLAGVVTTGVGAQAQQTPEHQGQQAATPRADEPSVAGASVAQRAPTAPEAVAEPVVHGQVTTAKAPVPAVKVYAYDVASLRFQKVLTDKAGRFLFRALPAGLYKVIAIKEGFLPAVQVLRRWQEESSQRLDLSMAPNNERETIAGEMYWEARKRVPAGVLRDAADPWSGELVANREVFDATTADLGGFETQLSGLGGVAAVPEGYDGQLTGANLGVRGTVGSLDVGVRGNFQQLTPDSDSGAGQPIATAEQRGLAVQVESASDHQVRLSSTTGSMDGLTGGRLRPVDLEHHHLQWTGPTGNAGRAGITASITQESNFFQPGWMELDNLPASSRTLNVAGSYSGNLGEETSLEAGVRYHERTAAGVETGLGFSDQRLDIFGSAGRQIQPRVMVEVGLYSQVRDGSLSLMPSGSFVVDLGKDWSARTSIAHRFERQADDVPVPQSFHSTRFGDSSGCQQAGEACYEVFFSRGDPESGQLSVGAIHREYAETLRVYFSDDFFNRLESLYLVRGDVVPEVQVSWARRLAPKILARLQSNYAEGGGGLVYATDDRSFENDVRYLVTSIDTQFERTSTGVFVAFHHLRQSLHPLEGEPALQLERERLQLMLTQDLDVLRSLPSNWAVRLNMELSRGSSPYTLEVDDELKKTLTGGIAVSF